MARLRLALLGPPRAEVDGAPIQVDTRKAIALLAYLAASGERHGRDQLADLLWPDHDTEHARAALRRTLSALNRALGGGAAGWLLADRSSVGLDDRDLDLDLRRFHDLLAACRAHGHPTEEVCQACVEPLTEAAALHRGDFMAGFALRDAVGFEDWQLLQSERLRRELAAALDRLALALAGTRAWERAIEVARRRLALDRLHEPAHRQLMQVYAWSGQRPAALRQYRDCVRVLDQELGVPPLEETTALYRAISEGLTVDAPTVPEPPAKVAPPPSAAATSAEASPASPGEPPAAAPEPPAYPLVGRATQRAALLEAHEAARRRGRLLVLEGEAGIGKTRLAEDFLAEARRRGSVTMAARCYEEQRDLAYVPFVEGLRTALARREPAGWVEEVPAHWLAEAARLLPDLAELREDLPAPAPPEGPGAQGRFFEGMRQVLLAALRDPAAATAATGPPGPTGQAAARGASGPAPGVLFLDDLQWADDASLDLLTYLVRRLRDQPLLVVVTWRREEVPKGHRLRRLVADARREGTATVLPLERLDRDEVAELLRAVAPDRAGAAADLHRETEGLPFFLVEYLAAMAAEPDGATAPALPGNVRELLRARLASVGETGWQLLTAAAVIGHSFDFELVLQASGRSEDEAVAALEELLARGLVHEMAGSARDQVAYDFSHEKLRALAYEETSLARRRLLHRRVAEAMTARERARGDTGPMAGMVAYHYRFSGLDELAAAWYALAGDHARKLYANQEALTHFHAALGLGHPDSAALHERIGDLRTLVGDYDAALASYEAAAARGGDLPGLEQKLGNLYLRRGSWEAAERHLEAALAALEPATGDREVAPPAGEVAPDDAARQVARRARIAADQSLAAHHRGHPERAGDLARHALDLAERSGDTPSLAQAHNILGILANSAGDHRTARGHLDQSLALAETLPDPSGRVAALNNLALVHGAAGDLDEALRHARDALDLCVAQGDRHREAALHNNLADLLHAAGRSEEAMAHLKRAAAIFGEVGRLEPEIWKLVEW